MHKYEYASIENKNLGQEHFSKKQVTLGTIWVPGKSLDILNWQA